MVQALSLYVEIEDIVLSFLPKLQFGPALIPAALRRSNVYERNEQAKYIEEQIVNMKDERGSG